MANKVIIMVGKPGSGKSTYAKSLGNEYSIVNQDILGNRNKCIEYTKLLLNEDKSVIIDRTNINKKQRAYWVKIAKEYNVTDISCIEFKIDSDICIERILSRKDHPTIKENTSIEKISEIVRRFENEYEAPSIDEGFNCHQCFYFNPTS